jgi:hypothetical protein
MREWLNDLHVVTSSSKVAASPGGRPNGQLKISFYVVVALCGRFSRQGYENKLDFWASGACREFAIP